MNRFSKLPYLLILFLLQTVVSIGQEQVCNRPVPLYYKFEQVTIEEPEDALMKEEYSKIGVVDKMVLQSLRANASFDVIPAHDYYKAIKQQGYGLLASVAYDDETKQYQCKLDLVTTCNMNLISSAATSFQMYPSWDVEKVVDQTITKLFSQINLAERELKERTDRNVGLGGDIWGGEVYISMEETLAKGELVDVLLNVKDCDGQTLGNKLISTNGTVGGTFTPATFKTNTEGFASVKFRMTSDKTAIIKAQSETENVWGCKDLYTGTKVIKGLGGVPVKIEVGFMEQATTTVQHIAPPGTKMSGREETEALEMHHVAILYHYPTAQMVKDGYLVEAVKDTESNARTIHIYEQGWSIYNRILDAANFRAGPGEFFSGNSLGEIVSHDGSPNEGTRSEITFYIGKPGDTINPTRLSWSVEYPISGDGIGFGLMEVRKGDPGVIWKEKKITDPKSIYKMEYTIHYTVDLGKEFHEGNKNVKKMFGFDATDVGKVINPEAKSGGAGASGTREIAVKIYSPYVR